MKPHDLSRILSKSAHDFKILELVKQISGFTIWRQPSERFNPEPSLIVDTEDDTGAEERVVGVGEGGEVVVLLVPEALAGHADPLALSLADNGLDHDLVGRDAQELDAGLDLVGHALRHGLGLAVLVLLVLQVVLHDLLDARLHLARVETVRFFGLEAVRAVELRGHLHFERLIILKFKL